MGMLMLGSLAFAACQSDAAEVETQEEMDFTDEAGNSGEEGEGFDFSEDDAADPDQGQPADAGEPMTFDPDEVDDFDFELCLTYADYVPCGTYAVDPTAGSMTCGGQTMALEDQPEEFLTLVPANEDGSQLFAQAAGSGEGTLSLVEVQAGGAIYEGVLVNSEGQSINYTLNYVSGSGYLFGSFGGTFNNPGTAGDCTFTREYDGFTIEE